MGMPRFREKQGPSSLEGGGLGLGFVLLINFRSCSMLDKYLVSEVTSFCLPLYFPGMGSTLAGYYERHVKGTSQLAKKQAP
jgi:hypothetical protein